MNECGSNPCENGGSCSLIGSNYVCDCISGYRGLFCEIEPMLSGIPFYRAYHNLVLMLYLQTVNVHETLNAP